MNHSKCNLCKQKTFNPILLAMTNKIEINTFLCYNCFTHFKCTTQASKYKKKFLYLILL